ncbi:S-layer homology domain-containing protein [Paenibacillus sp. GCM10012307]
MKRKLSTIAMGTLLTISLTGQAYAAPSTFTDLDKTAVKAQIMSLQEQGIVKGVSASKFLPDQVLTAAEGIQLITNTFHLSLAAISFNKAPTASGVFDHVKDDAWFAEAFINAHFNGVEIPKDIDPLKPLTREEFTIFFMQAMEKSGQLPLIKIAPPDIKDGEQIAEGNLGLIQRSLIMNINKLDKDGNFNPQEHITRAETASLIYTALEYLKANPHPAE